MSKGVTRKITVISGTELLSSWFIGVLMLNFSKCFFPNRIASVSKIFPTIMLYKMWEEGKVTSLDDPLERYVQNFVIKNPLGRLKDSGQRYAADGLIFLEKGSMPLKPSLVTLRRMASQLSGEAAPLERHLRESRPYSRNKKGCWEVVSHSGPCTVHFPGIRQGSWKQGVSNFMECLKGTLVQDTCQERAKMRSFFPCKVNTDSFQVNRFLSGEYGFLSGE